MESCDRTCSSPAVRAALLIGSCMASVGASVANYFVSGKTQDIALKIGEQCVNKIFNATLANTTCAALETSLSAFNRSSYGLLLFAPTVTIIVGGCAFVVSMRHKPKETQENRRLIEEV